ncbi:hypothetical protein NW757_013365 [Fusarium falciforme]|nr:hypothetical protein NW757_013365 [Fusarium falciforme]
MSSHDFLGKEYTVYRPVGGAPSPVTVKIPDLEPHDVLVRITHTGVDIYCYERVTFGEGDFDNGTFGTYYIGKQTFLHKIPENLASEHAAPLQCAGTTVYAALKATVTNEKRVGIFGIGGLGHLAIQYAAKMGAEVVVYSTTASKEGEAQELGATEFHLISEMFDKKAAPIDVLVVAGSKYPDWEKYV